MVEKENSGRSSGLTLIILIGQAITIGVIILLFIFVRSGIETKKPGEDAAASPLAVADMLYSQELYQAAAEQYSNVVDEYRLSEQKTANITFKIGEIYLEKLGQYPEALAFFLRAENHDVEERLSKSIGEKKVECLERMKRATDAQRVLEESTLLDQSDIDRADATAVVAEIGNKDITVRQLDHYIDMLPDEAKSSMTRNQKISFLQQLVATELIYNAAKRKGYGRDPKLIETITQFEKSLMVQKYISEELSDSVTITPTDLQLYYEAHKDEYDQKPFEEVQEKVVRDFQNVKYQEALSVLFERLSAAEKVTLHPNNITE